MEKANPMYSGLYTSWGVRVNSGNIGSGICRNFCDVSFSSWGLFRGKRSDEWVLAGWIPYSSVFYGGHNFMGLTDFFI